jgi:uncharacterized protein YkwD
MNGVFLTLLLMAADPQPQQVVSPENDPQVQQLLVLTNQARVGLRQVELSKELCAAAQHHANYMANTRHFSHVTSNGQTHQHRSRLFGFIGMVRENIAMNQSDCRFCQNQWLTSSGHYANIRSDSTHVGFARAVSPEGNVYWVGMYGTGTGSSVPIDPEILKQTENTQNTQSNYESSDYYPNQRRFRGRFRNR